MGVTVVREPGAGERIGEAFSGSVQGLLKGLVESKLQTMQKEKLAERQEKTYQAHRQQNIDGLTKYWEMQGYPHAEAVAFAEQGPAFAKSVMDRMEGFSLGGGQQQQQQMQQQPQQMQQQPTAEGNLYSSMGIPEYNAQIDPNMLTGLGAGAPMQPGMQQGAMQPAGQPPAGGLRIGPPPAERRHRENLAVRKEAVEQKKETATVDRIERRQFENKRDLAEAVKSKRSANDQIKALDHMEELDKTGKVNHPAFINSMDKMGLGWMLSAETQAASAEGKVLFRDFKETFGSKPIGIEFEAFMKSIPTLQNTREGRALITKNLKLYLQARNVKADVMMDILKKDKNISPLDLTMQTAEQTDAKIDKIYGKIKKIPPTTEEDATTYIGLDTVQDEYGRAFIWDKEGKRYVPSKSKGK